MTRPQRHLLWMAVFLAIVLAICVPLAPSLIEAFRANPFLNGLILGVLLIGIGYSLRQVLMLYPVIGWIARFREDREGRIAETPPELLAPMAAMLGERRARFSLSTMSLRSLLDGIASRLDEQREISRYFIGLLIFLGLLGTFWGLLRTVDSVADVIGNLSVAADDLPGMFGSLKAGLQAPLSGMGTAFSSSLFGLAGSLVLGFLDLQAGQAQNRFYNELEEWLAGATRLSSGGPGGGEGDASVPAYIQALLEQNADNLEELQRTLTRGEEDRYQTSRNLASLADRLSTLTDQMRTEQALMVRLAENQRDLGPILTRLVEAAEAGFGMDETTRNHIRNLDMGTQRLLEDQTRGREDGVREIRNEIKLLARTIAAIAEEEQR
ncbi:MAG: flagellar motor protein MotA [Rhodospirillaceae bacterium]|jgi:hypothetical protein|nr:flagellar motor protein MotA [Rhodospirillaceae bacterium]